MLGGRRRRLDACDVNAVSSPPAALPTVTLPFVLPGPSFFTLPRDAPIRSLPPQPQPTAAEVRVDNRLGWSGHGSRKGPAFVGQVFTMLDSSGNGLMAVTSRYDIPFLSKRTPEWLKTIWSSFSKSQNGPVFRFFMDLNDAVSYVKRLNVPTGMVGACRLDVAYEYFKDKPHLFQFVPNEKQVRAANKLLKVIPREGRSRKIDGVPVFSAQNLNIAIATTDGIRWYTPYFFDKGLLDNILETSMDQHFNTMIQTRHLHRRRDVIDDSVVSEMIEESGDSLFEPPEVQELMNEMGHSAIPLSVVTKAAEIQFLDVVDKVLLGNKWLRKVTGIQPQFPYLVESFEERTSASFSRATEQRINKNAEDGNSGQTTEQLNLPQSKFDDDDSTYMNHTETLSKLPCQLNRWLPNLWPGKHGNLKLQDKQGKHAMRSDGDGNHDVPLSPLLPKITMVGVSMSNGGQVSNSSLKKTMDELTKELEQASQKAEMLNEENDPLFVANVGDYSRITRINTS